MPELLQRWGVSEIGIRWVTETKGSSKVPQEFTFCLNRPEDVLKTDADEDGIGGDDCADALRYLVATKSRTVSVRKLRGF